MISLNFICSRGSGSGDSGDSGQSEPALIGTRKDWLDLLKDYVLCARYPELTRELLLLPFFWWKPDSPPISPSPIKHQIGDIMKEAKFWEVAQIISILLHDYYTKLISKKPPDASSSAGAGAASARWCGDAPTAGAEQGPEEAGAGVEGKGEEKAEGEEEARVLSGTGTDRPVPGADPELHRGTGTGTGTWTPVVTRIVMNFGSWETALALNPNLRECHAHSHFWLSRAFIRAIEGDTLMAALHGHNCTPDDYCLENVRLLERDRFFQASFADIRAQLDTLATKSDLAHLKEELKQEMETMLNAKFDALSTRLTQMMPTQQPPPSSSS